MAVDKQMRTRIDKLIEVYLNDLESTTKAAGWHQPSQMELMAAVRVQTSGDKADMKMINEIRYIREEHALLGQARYLFGVPIGQGEMPEEQALAMLASRFYRGRQGDEVAALIGMTYGQYRGRLERGREVMALELMRLDRVFECMAMAG